MKSVLWDPLGRDRFLTNRFQVQRTSGSYCRGGEELEALARRVGLGRAGRGQRVSPGSWPGPQLRATWTPWGHWDRGIRGMTLLSQHPHASESAGQSQVISKPRRELGDLDGVLGDPADDLPSGQSQRRTPHTNGHRHYCSPRHTNTEGERAFPVHTRTVHRCVLR